MKQYTVTVMIILMVFCTAPIREYLQPEPDGEDSTSVAPVDSGSSTKAGSLKVIPPRPGHFVANPAWLPSPSRWPGNYFIILPKQQLVASFGYNLFSCTDTLCDSHEVDPEWEHENHRIRSGAISGDMVMVSASEPQDNEWLVTFRHRQTQKLFYGKTHNQAIAEIVCADDLANAKKRWLDKFVFSKRGVISIPGTNSSAALASHRVRIQDSLLVTDVTAGITPLPVKPLWLHVLTSDSVKGFIPVRYSWTNTMNTFKKDVTPWGEDIFEENPLELFSWSEDTWDLINNHRVVVDMTTDQVRLSWGSPEKETNTTDGEAERLLWNYPSHIVVFRNNRVVAVEGISGVDASATGR
jgi:hypothetical protein